MNDESDIRAISGTNIGGASAHNRRVIVDALRVNGALSRASLARATQLTKQTVSNIMDELETLGLVKAQETVRNGRGKPATPYALAPDGAYALGLQIDRHVARVVAVNLIGEVLLQESARLSWADPQDGLQTLSRLIAAARQTLSEGKSRAEERLVGLGVAMPGPFDVEDEGEADWAMSRWQQVRLAETLNATTGLQVAIQNDAAAAAIAERMVGAAQGVDHAVCLYLGYGLGAGLIVNGELFCGQYGNAGEIGMVLAMGPEGEAEPLEHRASVGALCRVLGLDPADPALFARIDAALRNPGASTEIWLNTAARHLRWTVHLLESLLDPETVILCGGAPRILIEQLLALMQPLRPSSSLRRQRALPRIQAGLADPWAVAIGAAAEPIARAFDPRFSALLKPTANSRKAG